MSRENRGRVTQSSSKSFLLRPSLYLYASVAVTCNETQPEQGLDSACIDWNGKLTMPNAYTSLLIYIVT